MDKLIATLKHGKSIPIILALYEAETPLRFMELANVLEMNHRNLSLTLKVMTENGFITCTRHAEVPPRVEYALTPAAKLLAAALISFNKHN